MRDLENSIIYNKSFSFSLQIVELYKYLCVFKKEYILSKQLLRSGTSIGANFAQSKKDFVSKMHIALKESSESFYWISLLVSSKTIDKASADSLIGPLDEIIKMLNAIITTSKRSLTEKKA